MLIINPSALTAQTPDPDKKPRKEFFTLFLDWISVSLMNFKEFPLEELTGTELNYNYSDSTVVLGSNNNSITVTNTAFSKHIKGAGIMIYPFGTRNGWNLMLKTDYQNLPHIKFSINSPQGQEKYELINGKAYDFGIGLLQNESQSGWGFGSRSFILAGIGRIAESRGDGQRYFAEAGVGFNTGPIGADLFFGIAQNRLVFPRPHKFYTVPIGVRTTFSF